MDFKDFIKEVNTHIGDVPKYMEENSSGDGVTKIFDLSEAPIANHPDYPVVVKLGDTTWTVTTDYTIDYEHGRINAVNAPAAGTNNFFVSYYYEKYPSSLKESLIKECVRNNLYPWFYVRETDGSQTINSTTASLTVPTTLQTANYNGEILFMEIEYVNDASSIANIRKYYRNYRYVRDNPTIDIMSYPTTRGFSGTLFIHFIRSFIPPVDYNASMEPPESALYIIPMFVIAHILMTRQEPSRLQFEGLTSSLSTTNIPPATNFDTGRKLLKEFYQEREKRKMPFLSGIMPRW